MDENEMEVKQPEDGNGKDNESEWRELNIRHNGNKWEWKLPHFQSGMPDLDEARNMLSFVQGVVNDMQMSLLARKPAGIIRPGMMSGIPPVTKH